jgi:16S rRNA (guanine(966)-N(2))-methyltransferase RsmD
MRVTGGIGKGRKLKVPAGSRVRPTSDKVKQALFNILGQKVEGALFLDLFAGVGGIGIEALSRGAGRVVLSMIRGLLKIIKKNLEQTGFAERAQVVASKAESFLKKRPSSLISFFSTRPIRLRWNRCSRFLRSRNFEA